MKKNLMTVLILALLIVNVVLTAIMMFSVTNMAKKTSALVTDISTTLKLDLANGTQTEEKVTIPMDEIDVYKIPEKMTIPLKMGEDGQQHFGMLSISLSMNTKDKGYKTHSESISLQESVIQDAIIEVFGRYTLEEARGNIDSIKEEIVIKLQEMYDSQFIYQVNFSDVVFQ